MVPRFRVSGSALVLVACFVACGGLKDGDVIVTDEGSGASGATGGSGGSGNGSGGDGTGESGAGGEPPVIREEAPSVVSITPEDEETDVDVDRAIEIEFSESLDPDTVSAESVTVTVGDVPVEGELDLSGTTLTFTPSSRLDLLSTLTVTVTTGVTDLSGAALEDEFTARFTVRDGVWGHQTLISNAVGAIDSLFVHPPVFDANGRGLVVWCQDPTDTFSDPSVVYGRFYEPGEGFGDSFPISTSGSGCAHPSAAMNEAGDAIVAWYQAEPSYDAVYARRYVDGAWEDAPQRIDDGTYEQLDYYYQVVTAISGTGEMHAVWTRTNGTAVSIGANHVTGLDPWDTSDPYLLGSWSQASAPTIAFGADGNGFATWLTKLGEEPVELWVARYVSTSGEWQNWTTVAVSDLDVYSAVPQVGTDTGGGAMVAVESSGADGDVRASRFTKSAGWGDALPVDTSAGELGFNSPRLVAVGDDFVLAYVQDVDGVRNVFVSRYSDGAWQAEPELVSDGVTSAGYVSDLGLGVDRHGNGILTWAQENTVHYARLNGVTGQWQAGPDVDAPEVTSVYELGRVRAGVAPNGVGAAVYCVGYANESTIAIHGAGFD
jgi:hypothetical protein